MEAIVPPDAPRGVKRARIVDLLVATTALGLLAPLLAVRAVVARAFANRWFDVAERRGLHGRPFHEREFAGPWPGRRLARLFELLAGDVAIAGPRAASAAEPQAGDAHAAQRGRVRPGLVAPSDLRRLVGIADLGELESERAWIAAHGPLAPLGLAIRWLAMRALVGPASRSAGRSLEVLGVRLANSTLPDAVAWIVRRALERRRTLVAFANVDCINVAQRDAGYRVLLGRADRVYADGIGVRLACRMLGQKMADNVNGTDLFPVLCESAARAGVSLFLLGAHPGVAARAAAAMQARYPGLRIAGTHDGYFDAGRSAEVVASINASGADVLLVAMGAPRQERWIARHERELQAPVRIGVGGLFDYYGGRIPRAPTWLREFGLEWVWRMAMEPRRLWRRYLLGNPLFLARVVAARATGRVDGTALAIRPSGSRVAAVGSRLRRRQPELRAWAARAAKRVLDVGAASVALLLLAPALALLAFAVAVESPGPVLFRQTRVGRHGRHFTMYKFRSMYVNAEARRAALEAANEMSGGVIFKMRDDPRVTRVGALIRRTSLDELPQLWNVLRGDMSIVGPRPPLPREVELYSPHAVRRLDVVPGITCIWQVSGRSEVPFVQQVEMDLDYIHRQSLREDVRLIVKTIPALLGGRGAY